jgi:hypothetical protein
VLHAEREQVTRDYAHILANDLFSADVILEAVVNGPSSERLFAAIEKEISAAIDEEAGLAKPLLTLTIGTKRYTEMKDAVVRMVVGRLPDAMVEAKEYESILRPVFKDDEMLMITVGAVLGFWVGELQVVLVEYLAR